MLTIRDTQLIPQHLAHLLPLLYNKCYVHVHSLHIDQLIPSYRYYAMGTYLLTHSLTPWCRIFFENLIVTQFVKQ